MTQLTGQFIAGGDGIQLSPDGRFIEAQGGDRLPVKNPVTHAVIGTLHVYSSTDIDASVDRARLAVSAWSERPLSERAALLHRWADQIHAEAKSLADVLMDEIAKNAHDALDEVHRSADYIHYTAEEALRLHGEALLSDAFPGQSRNKISLTSRVPVGVVLAIPPFNYPINLAVTKIAPALMMGNTVIVKPPTQGAFSGLNIIALAYESGIPTDVLIPVIGPGSTIGDALVRHQLINLVSFTGSSETGAHIAQQVKMVPLQLELGGKDAALVLPDADINRAADHIVSGAFAYSGQRCTAVKRVLALESIADHLNAALVERVERLTVGYPTDNAIITPLISVASADYVWDLVAEAVQQGAKPLTPLRRDGSLIYPIILDRVELSMRIAWEEPFGPVLPIIRVSSVPDAIEVANRSEYGLQAALFTKDIAQAIQIAEKLDVGTVQINGKTSRGPDHFPFVGTKASGMGAQGVRHSLLAMSRVKSLVLNL